MAVQPAYSPKWRSFDASGDPLSGGLLYTYSAGTSTPLATYTTRAGDVANANPVVLDANGEANVWLTPGVSYKFELRNSSGVVQWTVDNIPSPAEQDTISAVSVDPGGRLTLTTATPVTTSDVTGATTVYYSPHKSNLAPLYDGTAWTLYEFSELSQATTDNTKSPAAVTTDSNYDIFLWNDSGTLRATRGPAWSSATARGTGAGTTELERVDGRYVNKVSISNGPAAQRGLYVGTIRTDGSSQVNDSVTKRHCWNTHHRARRHMLKQDLASWTYNTNSFRQANGSTANQLDYVCGLAEDAVEAQAQHEVNSTSAGTHHAAVGVDSTTTASGLAAAATTNTTGPHNMQLVAAYRGVPGLGRHFLAWLERGNGAGTTTWNTTQYGGLTATVMA